MVDDPKSLVPAQPLCCSFCGHNQFEVRQLIAGGPDQATPSVFICNECVMMCVEILLESGYVRLQFEQTTPPPAEKPRRGRRRKKAG